MTVAVWPTIALDKYGSFVLPPTKPLSIPSKPFEKIEFPSMEMWPPETSTPLRRLKAMMFAEPCSVPPTRFE